MEAVAAAAGVTRVTAYNQFGSRTGLVEAVLDEVVARDRMDRLVEGTRSLEPAAALDAAIAATCAFWYAERPLLRRLFAAAYEDPAVAALLQRREGWRRDQLVALLARADAPSDGPGDGLSGALDRSSAADLLTAVTSFPAYDRLGEAADDPARAAELLGLLVRPLVRPAG